MAQRQAEEGASMTRLPDAGTTNEYTIVGDMKVYVWPRNHTVLNRSVIQREAPLVAVQNKAHDVVTMTPHQARALSEVLLAAADLADEMEKDE
jgi:hypothetical protein